MTHQQINTHQCLAVSVGNSRTAISIVRDNDLHEVHHCSHEKTQETADTVLNEIESLCRQIDGEYEPVVLIGSVNNTIADKLTEAIEDQDGVRILRAERDVPIPIGRCLDPETIVGHDRLLNAAAAYDRFKQACIVIDAGTAVTVDFIDGEGTFHGGAIAPGAVMQLKALHRETTLLPEVELAAPNDEAWGANTTQAMLHGVCLGIRGMARYLIERYSEVYGAYPTIIATGGDAHLLFDRDELIEHIIDDLTLQGLAVTWKIFVNGPEES